MNIIDNPDHRELAQRADALRARLSATLGELDRRRHEFFDVGAQLRRHPLPKYIAGAGLLAMGTGAAVALALHLHARRKDMMRRRLRVAAELWRHPERLLHPQPSLPAQVVRGVLVGVLSAAGGEFARRAVVRYFNRPPELPLPAGPAPPGSG